jgi:hypothetical protein
MQGASQVMWAKDRTYNKEGFIQEGALGNVSFYYSLIWMNRETPRL